MARNQPKWAWWLTGLLVPVALLLGNIAWDEYSKRSLETPNKSTPTTTTLTTAPAKATPTTTTPTTPTTTTPAATSKRPRTEPIFPLEFFLRHGEQKVLLGGQASVGIEFHQVGGLDLITLVINSSRSQPVRLPIQSSGERVEVTIESHSYYVYLLQINWSDMTAQVRVDRKSEAVDPAP